MRKQPSSKVSCLSWLAIGTLMYVAQLSAEVTVHPKGVIDGADSKALAGGVLTAELQCVRCHAAPGQIVSYLNTRSAPHLESLGKNVSPDWIRDFIGDPYQTKAGTGHPDMFHSVPEAGRSEKIENLTHFIKYSSGGAEEIADKDAVGADPYQMETGRRLFHQVGCVACHAPQEPVSAFAKQESGSEDFFGLEDLKDEDQPAEDAAPQSDWKNLESQSIPLGNLARKTTVAALAEYLQDPKANRPWSRMPNLGLTEREARSIAMYLLREQAPGMYDPNAQLNKIAGVRYQYFETSAQTAGFPAILDSGEPKKTGILATFGIDAREREENFGFRFTGLVRIREAGQYTFYTASDDGSEFYINGEHLVKNGGDHGRTEKSGSMHLNAGDHPFILTYYNRGGGFELDVYYAGPGIEKQPIPANALFNLGQQMKPTAPMAMEINADRIQAGAQIYSQLQCVNCHGSTTITAKSWEYPKAADTPFLELDLDACGSCVDALAGPDKPKYNWSSEQRQSVAHFIASVKSSTEAPSAQAQLTHRMAQLNCFACHQRDGLGGPSDLRREYFQTLGEADLGDEGRIPPLLENAGAKLKKSWLMEVLNEGAKARPYMATRMPKFEQDAAFLVNHFVTVDHQSGAGSDPVEDYDITAGKYGRKLVGAVNGLSCVTCHTFGEYPSLGIPAMSLTLMERRLNKSWFKEYMVDPARFRPGTRMPTFWPDGKAVNKQVLDGNTSKQLDAIWMYLSRREEADPPPGLVQGQMEIVASNEAVIYRHFIQDAGSRAIGVGYPEKANLAWDANQLRLALIWHGPFIDAARHRIGRGTGYEGPLGNNVRKFAAGPNFAMLENPQTTPWPDTAEKSAGYEMRGYILDDVRRPTFLYSLGDIQFSEKFTATSQALDATFKRELTVKSTAGTPDQQLWFRAAAGSEIEASGNGGYRIDQSMIIQLKSTPGSQPVIRSINGQKELLVPVRFLKNGEFKITQEILW